MAKLTTVKVIGVKELKKALSSIDKDIRDNAIKAINETAMQIRTKALRNAPVDTGRLRSSTINTFAKYKKEVHLIAATVEVRTKYAAFVEFGTARMGAKTNRQDLPEGYTHGMTHKWPGHAAGLKAWARHHGTTAGAVASAIVERVGNPAQPFLFPAAESERAGLVQRLSKIVPKGKYRKK